MFGLLVTVASDTTTDGESLFLHLEVLRLASARHCNVACSTYGKPCGTVCLSGTTRSTSTWTAGTTIGHPVPISFKLKYSMPLPVGVWYPPTGTSSCTPGEYTTSPSTPLDEASPTGCALIFAVRVPSCQGSKFFAHLQIGWVRTASCCQQ